MIKLFLIITFLTNSVFAMQVSPIKIYLNQKEKIQNLNITNNTNKTKTYQNTLYKWDVDINGKSIITPTTPIEIMSSPLIYTLKPNETKSLKIGKMIIKNNNPENFRIIVKDITPSNKKGVSIKMASSIPIFVSHKSSKKDKNLIKTKYEKSIDEISIEIENQSNVFQEISEINFNNKFINKIHYYLLPNKKIKLKFDLNQKEKYKEYRLKFLNGIEIKKEIK